MWALAQYLDLVDDFLRFGVFNEEDNDRVIKEVSDCLSVCNARMGGRGQLKAEVEFLSDVGCIPRLYQVVRRGHI